MNIEEVRSICLDFRNVTESFPFDEETLVFKVENKIFLLLPLNEEDPHFAVKCAPDKAEALRAHYDAVEPAFHLNKKHWNDIYLLRDMSSESIREQIEASYHEVIKKLPLRLRKQYDP